MLCLCNVFTARRTVVICTTYENETNQRATGLLSVGPRRPDSSLESGVVGIPPPILRATGSFTAAEVEQILTARDKEVQYVFLLSPVSPDISGFLYRMSFNADHSQTLRKKEITETERGSPTHKNELPSVPTPGLGSVYPIRCPYAPSFSLLPLVLFSQSLSSPKS